MNNNISFKPFTMTLVNGLKVTYLIKKGFNKKYAIIGVNYGSNDHNFIMDGKTYKTPSGIAHFLEHKLFEMPDFSDAFMTLTSLGASSNAFTSNNKTCYLFSTTNSVKKPLKVLLDFVFTPFFDPKRVEEEKGIIASEIKMYKDYYDYQLQLEVIKSLYHNSTLSEDIAGEVEDILKVDAEALMANYKAFYQPSNMHLCLVGDINHLEIHEYLNKILASYINTETNVQRLDNIENSSIRTNSVTIFKPVQTEKFCIGIKLPFKATTPIFRLKEELIFDALINLLFSKSSKFYQNLLDLELINDSFSTFIDYGPNYRYLLIEGMSNTPEKTTEVISKYLEKISESLIIEEELEIFKKKTIGELIMSENSLELIANNYLSYAMLNLDYLAITKTIWELKVTDLIPYISFLTKENTVFGIMKKLAK